MSIPVIEVRASNLPMGWERSVLRCWNEGIKIETEYDRPGDPKSRDCTMVLVVSDPMSEPRIHRAMPAGLGDLEVYRQEVLYGIHDHWIDPDAGKWEYTYHERLFAYRQGGFVIDQIKLVIDKLAEAPHTRRAQAVTWKAWTDPLVDDPPCLQRLWFRIMDDKLCMNIHIRSNDAYKAGFMNMYVFTEIQKFVAEQVSEQMGRHIMVGQYVHIADSFHIYGSDFAQFNGFLDTVDSKRTFEERTWTTQFAKPHFDEARKRIASEIYSQGDS